MAYEAFGTDLEKGNTADYLTASSWVSVGCLSDLTLPTLTVEDNELPVCLNADSREKQFVPGVIDISDVSWSLMFAEGDFDDMQALLAQYGSWRAKLGSSTSYLCFNGYFKTVGIPQITQDGFIQLTCGAKCNSVAEILASEF